MKTYTRRAMLRTTGQALFLGSFAAQRALSAGISREVCRGLVIGEEAGSAVGEQVLAEGGNAVDAAVAACLASCVATPARCGVGGYGGHMTIAQANGKVTCIDFNSEAPAAARPDMYPLEPDGKVSGDINVHGWKAVGVPGTLAGLQLAASKYGTRSFRQLVQPALKIAREGVPISAVFARAIRGALPRFRADPGSARLYLKAGQPLAEGDLLRNPDLAELLAQLAEDNSVESFYRGEIGRKLAEQFAKHGGLVTVEDLAEYHAREVKPLKMTAGKYEIWTAPLTAGGLTVLQALSILCQFSRNELDHDLTGTQIRLEAMRLAWKDRLKDFADPEKVKVSDKYLSKAYIRELSNVGRVAVQEQRPVVMQIPNHEEEGTNNLSAMDWRGNMVAVTITQGGGFGAQVTAEGLGVTLGHGMSRFDPHPRHPNAPGPRKRPLHNMCPSVVTVAGKPLAAIGGAGGVKIPNSLFEVLYQFLLNDKPMQRALESPRLQCTGTLQVSAEKNFPVADLEYLKKIGYRVTPGESARISTVWLDSASGHCAKAMR
jgi:gamma-glutamyltranspeptidase/glutathione hydrolase